ncbi:ABC transporter ATP-binding protein [Rhodococcus fascians]|nr:ABC transporter ATP-binding protein [Rhodococcus fascians]
MSSTTITESGETVVRARSLRFSIGRTTVGPVDLEVGRGRVMGIVGETGSGKTLLCRTLTGMLQACGGSVVSGEVDVLGRRMTDANKQQWTRLRRGPIGYMPQASLAALNPVRRVGAQMEETLRYSEIKGRSGRRTAAAQLLERVQLRDVDRVMRSYPHQLSGGMRQRVLLAMALIGDPQLLVADEPTTALDATVQVEILKLLQGIQKAKNMSMILVSHDLASLRAVCDDITVMRAGSVVEQGYAQDVFGNPQHPYTRALLASDPALVPRGSRLLIMDDQLTASQPSSPAARTQEARS